MFHVKQSHKFVFHVKHCLVFAFVFHVKHYLALVLPCSVLPCVLLSVSRLSCPMSRFFAAVRRAFHVPEIGRFLIFKVLAGLQARAAFLINFPLMLVLFLPHRGRGGDLPAAGVFCAV